MSNAAAGDLPVSQRGDFDAHIRSCAACGAEFNRVTKLTEAIDRGVAARVAAEPSPEFFARVRRKIAADTVPANANWVWWAPAAACVAIVLATAVWMMWPKSAKPSRIAKTAPTNNSQMVANHVASNRGSVGESKTALSHLSRTASIRRVAAHNQRRIEREPEVLVPPGQAEAVMELAAALQNGKIDGVKLMADLKNAEQPIEIKPLMIPPLETPGQNDGAASKPSGNNEQENLVGDEKALNFVK
jgi:hypothetical protein